MYDVFRCEMFDVGCFMLLLIILFSITFIQLFASMRMKMYDV